MDFVQTMKDWRRMCETIQSQNQQKSNGGWCGGCPLQGYCVIDTEIKDSTDSALAIIEKRIRSWAAENPEPVYPTWGEYLASIGVMKPAQPDKAYEVWFTQLYSTNISANIAQKLGIEPKER